MALAKAEPTGSDEGAMRLLRRPERRLQGLPLVPGIAVGPAFRFECQPCFEPRILSGVTAGGESVGRTVLRVEQEIARFRSALDLSRRDVQIVKSRMAQEGSQEGADILDAHLMMLKDPMITDYIEDQLRRSQESLERVIHGFIEDCQKKFNRIADDSFRLRLQDIQDVINRILGHLGVVGSSHSVPETPCGAVIFSQEVSPSMVMEAKRLKYAGFVTLMGGETSHAAIIARARGIPFVSQIEICAEDLQSVSSVIVDGYSGIVILDPSEETKMWFIHRAEELREALQMISRDVHLPAQTSDGVLVDMGASIKLVEELPAVGGLGCSGIGLYRSEMLLEELHGGFPSEEMQLQAYCAAIKASGGQSCTLRVFDIGGDKPYGLTIDRSLGYEQNPFLGCRGLRFLLRHPELLHTQLRAAWRASLYGSIRLLVPLVTNSIELIEFQRRLQLAREELQQEGCLLPPRLDVGVMIETPAAALMVHKMLEVADFIAVGTNDLVQYTLAVERGNPTLAHIYSPFEPAVVDLLKRICQSAASVRKEVCFCGELAGDPRAASMLVGLGASKLVVSPHQMPIIKQVIRSFSMAEATALSEEVAALESAAAVRSRLEAFLRDHCPIVALIG